MILVLSANCAVRHQFYPQWALVLWSHIMSSKKHSNAAGLSSRGSASKRRMQLTSYLWKKIGMLWKNYGKAMEFLFLGSVRTLILILELRSNLSTQQGMRSVLRVHLKWRQKCDLLNNSLFCTRWVQYLRSPNAVRFWPRAWPGGIYNIAVCTALIL